MRRDIGLSCFFYNISFDLFCARPCATRMPGECGDVIAVES